MPYMYTLPWMYALHVHLACLAFRLMPCRVHEPARDERIQDVGCHNGPRAWNGRHAVMALTVVCVWVQVRGVCQLVATALARANRLQTVRAGAGRGAVLLFASSRTRLRREQVSGGRAWAL